MHSDGLCSGHSLCNFLTPVQDEDYVLVAVLHLQQGLQNFHGEELECASFLEQLQEYRLCSRSSLSTLTATTLRGNILVIFSVGPILSASHIVISSEPAWTPASLGKWIDTGRCTVVYVAKFEALHQRVLYAIRSRCSLNRMHAQEGQWLPLHIDCTYCRLVQRATEFV